MTPNPRAEIDASVARVKTWKQHRIGRRPPLSDYRAYYRSMRWGPFSYWTWRGMAILLSGALIVYVIIVTVCLARGSECHPSMTWNPLTWFLRPVP